MQSRPQFPRAAGLITSLCGPRADARWTRANRAREAKRITTQRLGKPAWSPVNTAGGPVRCGAKRAKPAAENVAQGYSGRGSRSSVKGRVAGLQCVHAESPLVPDAACFRGRPGPGPRARRRRPRAFGGRPVEPQVAGRRPGLARRDMGGLRRDPDRLEAGRVRHAALGGARADGPNLAADARREVVRQPAVVARRHLARRSPPAAPATRARCSSSARTAARRSS